MAQNYALLQPADFEEQVARKLPPRGLAWPRLLGSVFQAFWQVIADALAQVHARAAVLSETESFPPTSVELLPDWEAVFGLPDPCLPQPASTTARQAAVRARLGATGGQSVPYFQDVAGYLGGTLAVTEYAPFRLGIDRFTQPLLTASWAYIWLATLTNGALFTFDLGISRFGEPLWQDGNGSIKCELQRLAPAHTQVNFQGFV